MSIDLHNKTEIGVLIGAGGLPVSANVRGDAIDVLVLDDSEQPKDPALEPAQEDLHEDTLRLHADQIQRVHSVLNQHLNSPALNLSKVEKEELADVKKKDPQNAFKTIARLKPEVLRALSKLKLSPIEVKSIADVQTLTQTQRIKAGLNSPTPKPKAKRHTDDYSQVNRYKTMTLRDDLAAKFEVAALGVDYEAAYDPYNIHNITNGRPTHHYVNIKVESALAPSTEDSNRPAGYVLTVTEVPDNGKDSVRINNSAKNVKTITVTAEEETAQSESKKNTGSNVASAYAKYGIVLGITPGMAPRPR